jgi:hypothetical protein
VKRSPLKRRTPVKSVNTKRRNRRREAEFGDQAGLCRTMPCCACGRSAPSDPHHEPPRGSGGKDGDTVPLCRSCHILRHASGKRKLERMYGINLLSEAKRMQRSVADSSSDLQQTPSGPGQEHSGEGRGSQPLRSSGGER